MDKTLLMKTLYKLRMLMRNDIAYKYVHLPQPCYITKKEEKQVGGKNIACVRTDFEERERKKRVNQ